MSMLRLDSRLSEGLLCLFSRHQKRHVIAQDHIQLADLILAAISPLSHPVIGPAAARIAICFCRFTGQERNGLLTTNVGAQAHEPAVWRQGAAVHNSLGCKSHFSL